MDQWGGGISPDGVGGLAPAGGLSHPVLPRESVPHPLPMSELSLETAGSGPDLVLLHGWGLSRRVWRVAPGLLGWLGARHRVTLVDLPGHGASGGRLWPLDDVLAALAAALPARAHWLGWSLGGMLGLAFAARWPQRVRSLRLVAAVPRFAAAPDWPQGMAAGALTAMGERLAADRDGELRRFLALQFLDDPLPAAERRALQRGVRDAAPSAAALADGLRLLRTLDLRPAYAGLACPAAVLLGGRDRLVDPALAAALRTLNPAVPVRVLTGAGHAPFLTRPAAFRDWLREAARD